MTAPRYLSAREVAELLGCSYNAALRTMRAAGCLKIGALVRVSQDALDSYLTTCQDPASRRMSFAEKIAPGSGPTYPETNRTYRSKPTTRMKRKPDSSSCSSLEDYEKLRRGIGR